jgi:hypothetical protein
MSDQTANAAVMVSASVSLASQIDRNVSILNRSYFDLVGAENSNMSNAGGLPFSPGAIVMREEANIVEFSTESSDQVELEAIFNGLAKRWKEETGGYSLTMRRYAHPSYQSILALEPKKAVISLVLRELQQRPDRWFEALKALTKTNAAQDSKTFDETVQRWVEWGKAKTYIS